MFSPTAFFSLDAFKHREIFSELLFVWLALKNLPEYLQSLSLGEVLAPCERGVFLQNPETVSIGEGTVIEPGTYIRGPCVIGRNCLIRHGAYIRENVLVGDRCVIGHATEVKHSILLDGARAAHFAFVGDTILGNDVNLGAGVKCANLRLDGQAVQIRHQEETIGTGLRKLGAVLGDASQVGCNAVLNPGTLVGRGAKCCPNTTVGGVVGAGTLVRREQKQWVEQDR